MSLINASIGLYHYREEQHKKAIHSFLNTDLKVKLYFISSRLFKWKWIFDKKRDEINKNCIKDCHESNKK